MTRNPPLPRRLPGVRFELPPPAPDEVLPRMDIAFFVGFATRGPLDRAVAVQSLQAFERSYGPELVLARRPKTGEPVRGLLHACVRSFFSQGGRRCWVLRVAGEGVHTGVFAAPSLLLAQRADAAAPWRLAPATLVAATPGSGADSLRLAARLDVRQLRARPVAGGHADLLELDAPASAAAEVQPGDLLRVETAGVRLHGRADGVREEGGRCRIVLRGLLALAPAATALVLQDIELGDAMASPPGTPATGQWAAGGLLRARCRLPPSALPLAGALLALRLRDTEGASVAGWMALEHVDVLEAAGPGTLPEVELRGRPFVAVAAAGPRAAWIADGSERLARVLRVALQVREGEGAAQTTGPLAMAAGARHGSGSGSGSDSDSDSDSVFALDAQAGFPLVAPPLAGERAWLPLAELAGFDAGTGPVPSDLSPLERDGLAEFSWSLFAEPLLAPAGSDVLADRAEALRLGGAKPRALRGMHALFGGEAQALVDEPTLLAVPDAVHPGWKAVTPPAAWTELDPLPEPRPAPTPEGQPPIVFIDCAAEPLPPPRFLQGADPDASGGFSLFWTTVVPGATYRLEEAAEPTFAAPALLYEGPATRFAIVGKPIGSSCYRVRATLGLRRSWWSRPVRVEVGATGYEAREWQSDELLAIHRLMLRAAAGRGDVLAVLALPEHFDAAAAAAHAEALRDATPLDDPQRPPAIGADEARALSHGALYHPWIVIRRVDEVIRFAPDGAVCGQLAGTALQRGAWIAVANRPLRDVVALTPPGMEPELAQRQQLLDAQVNLLRSAPHGFVISSADTLIADAAWRPVNVRRLMCLLRRLAVRRGADYVFETNGPTLRRTVERGFEAVLDLLFRRGAFAGARPADAYRVDAGEALNTPRRRDAGQFWVELKVAPALPLAFLTLRLAREGERVVSRELH